MLEFFKKHFSNIIIAVLLGFFLSQQIPRWIAESELEGTKPEGNLVFDLEGNPKPVPPDSNKPSIGVFFATWCVPCKIELYRYNEAIKDGELDASGIFAVNIMEDPETVKKFVDDKGLVFPVYLDPDGQAAAAFKVEATPTIVYLDGNATIDTVTSGFGPLTIVRAKRHLSD